VSGLSSIIGISFRAQSSVAANRTACFRRWSMVSPLFDLLTPGRGGTHMLFFDPRDTTTNWTPSSADAINLHFLFGSYVRDATEHS